MVKGFSQKKIISQESLGQKLKNKRRKNKISLEEAEKETKIRILYLKLLEEGNYGFLPGPVYTIGFIRKYSDFLGLDSERSVSLCKQEMGSGNDFINYLAKANNQNGFKIAPSRKIKEIKFLITPRLVIIIILSLLVLSLLIYIWFSAGGLLSPPQLEVFYPYDQIKINQEVILVEGKTEQTARLFINDQEVILKQDGSFTQELKLEKGLNKIKVVAQNRIDKQSEKDLNIFAEY